MKLKKIASLMLAGVMAVSMLAGCATTSNEPEQPNQPEEPTATGYSVEMAENLSDAAKKDYIEFKDNNDDLAALKDALGNMSSVSIAHNAMVPQVVTPVAGWKDADTTEMIVDFVNSLDLVNTNVDYDWMFNNLTQANDVNASKTVKYGLLYVIDGTVDVNKALKQVAGKMENMLENLPNVNVSDTARYTYDYTVSASVVNKALEPFAGYTLSANFIAVTVTRVPTAA